MKCNTCDNEKECYATLYHDNYYNNGDYYILGHYGSEYDMQRYALKRGSYIVGDVCDACIKKYITEGKAQLIEDGVW